MALRLFDPLLNRLGYYHKAQADQSPIGSPTPYRHDTRREVVGRSEDRGGLLKYSILRGFAENCEPVRLAIQKRKSQLFAMDYTIGPSRESGLSPDDVKDQIAYANEFFGTQGGFGGPGRRFRSTLNQIVEDLFACGAFATYRRRNMGGGMFSIDPVDVGTIKPLLTKEGWIPANGEPAFMQYVGAADPIPMTADELWYETWDPRTNSRWSRGPVDYIFPAAVQFLAVESWNLAWFTDGDGDFSYWNVPDDWTPQQIREFNEWVVEMTATLQQRQKGAGAPMIPGGPKRQPRRPRAEAEYQETAVNLIRRIAAAFDVNATVLGFEGEQYKVSQEGQGEFAERWGNKPLCMLLGEYFTDVLQYDLGLTDLMFEYDLSQEDLESNAKTIQAAGPQRVSANDGRRMLGLEEAEGPLVDCLYEMTPSGPFVIGWVKGKAPDADFLPNAPGADAGDGGEDGSGGSEQAAGDGSGDGSGNGEEGTDGGSVGKSGAGRSGAVPDGEFGKAFTEDLGRWQRKAVNRLRQGSPLAKCSFESEHIPSEVVDQVRSGLELAKTEHDVLNVFAKVRGEDLEVQTSVLNLHRLLEAAREEQGRRQSWET
jgi:hypothetical protein